MKIVTATAAAIAVSISPASAELIYLTCSGLLSGKLDGRTVQPYQTGENLYIIDNGKGVAYQNSLDNPYPPAETKISQTEYKFTRRYPMGSHQEIWKVSINRVTKEYIEQHYSTDYYMNFRTIGSCRRIEGPAF